MLRLGGVSHVRMAVNTLESTLDESCDFLGSADVDGVEVRERNEAGGGHS